MKAKAIQKNQFENNIAECLVDVPFFESFGNDELSNVASYMELVEIEEGECLFYEGEKGDYVCFIIEGHLDVIKKTEKDEEIQIATLSKGFSIGEMSILDHICRSATIKAREKSTVASLSQEAFDMIIENHPKVGIRILKGLSRHLSLNMRRTSKLFAETSDNYMYLLEVYRNTF